MFYESNPTTNFINQMSNHERETGQSPAWSQALDHSLDALEDAATELEAGDLSHHRQELLDHLSNSIQAIKELIEPHVQREFTSASRDVEVYPPAALSERSSRQ